MPSEADIAIRATGLSKRFYSYARPHQRVAAALLGIRPPNLLEVDAVRDVSFEVHRGETLGVMGRNGSGKSTLLRLVCGSLEASSGTLEVAGRIAPLLGIGVGFDPLFTGRENVIHNALVGGASRSEIETRLDEIIEFANIGEFIDQPVRIYSSGMYARLAFAAAIHSNADIFVIDEILAVGDELFHRKCFAKLERLKKAGSTIFLVSHSDSLVSELCDRVAILEAGERVLTAEPKLAISRYQRLLYASSEQRNETLAEIREVDIALQTGGEGPAGDAASQPNSAAMAAIRSEGFDAALVPESTVVYQTRGAQIGDPRIENALGERVNVLLPERVYYWVYEVRFDTKAWKTRFGMMVKTVTGLEIGGQTSHTWNDGVECIEAGTALEVRFPFRPRLSPGLYFLNCGVVGLHEGSEVFLHRVLDAAVFRIEPSGADFGVGPADLSGPEPFEFAPIV